jgi:hypothetical protein
VVAGPSFSNLSSTLSCVVCFLQIALERSKTARQAIRMMGELATSLGFYAADWSGGDLSKGESSFCVV